MWLRVAYRLGFVAFLALVSVAAYTIERFQAIGWSGNAKLAGLVLVLATVAAFEVARILAGSVE